MLTIDSRTKKMTLTKGDTLSFDVNLRDANGDVYTPAVTDKITFAVRKNFAEEGDTEPDLEATVSGDGTTAALTITVNATATAALEAGAYKYDIQVYNSSSGVVDTVINGATLVITKEVAVGVPSN